MRDWRGEDMGGPKPDRLMKVVGRESKVCRSGRHRGHAETRADKKTGTGRRKPARA